MKQIYIFLLAFASFSLSAQVANHSVEDCNSNRTSIHQALAGGQPLIVLSKGFDCGICVSRAPGWGSWATNNPQVQVWGAMTNTYNNNIPSCNQVSNWVTNYGWSSVYTFVDSTKHFFQFGTPRYIVYDPRDSSEAYVGGNQTTARNTALGLVNTISLTERTLESLAIFYVDGEIQFDNIPDGNTSVEVYNLSGKRQKTFTLRRDHANLFVGDLPKGIYLVRLSNTRSAFTRKIVIS